MQVIVTRAQYAEDPDRVISFNDDSGTAQEVLTAHYPQAHTFTDHGADAGMFRDGTGASWQVVLWNVCDVN